MDPAHAPTTYRAYWIAWFVLLALTVTMVFLGNPVVLIGGMAIKAAIIGLVFMHLRFERAGLAIGILLATLGLGLLLFGLIVPDGMAR